MPSASKFEAVGATRNSSGAGRNSASGRARVRRHCQLTRIPFRPNTRSMSPKASCRTTVPCKSASSRAEIASPHRNGKECSGSRPHRNLASETRGQANRFQALAQRHSSGRLKNKRPSRCDFKGMRATRKRQIRRLFEAARLPPCLTSASACGAMQSPEASLACSIAERKALRSSPAFSSAGL